LKLILVRHGETLWNRENRIQGHTDVALSDIGHTQVQKLACSLKDEKIDAIYSSPLTRAYETARAISRFHDVDIMIDHDLKELNHGDFEGMTIAELKEKHETFLKNWYGNPASVIMPNGESLSQVQKRVWDVITTIMKTSKDSLVVSHGMAIMAILCKIQNLSLSDGRQMFVNMSSKTVVSFENGKISVVLLNDTSHL
jgi:broad specificity phosphatase PhoE